MLTSGGGIPEDDAGVPAENAAAGGADENLPTTGLDLTGFVLGGVIATGIGAVTLYATRRPAQAD